MPGASAPIAALSASGMPAEAFLFAGFLPHKQAARRKRLAELATAPATLVFFESPNRAGKAIADIAAVLGAGRRIALCREITKLHEEMVCGPAGEMAAQHGETVFRGEIVLLVEPPAPQDEAVDEEGLLADLLSRMSVSEAAAEAARLTGRPRRDLYRRALTLAAGGKPA